MVSVISHTLLQSLKVGGLTSIWVCVCGGGGWGWGGGGKQTLKTTFKDFHIKIHLRRLTGF